MFSVIEIRVASKSPFLLTTSGVDCIVSKKKKLRNEAFHCDMMKQ